MNKLKQLLQYLLDLVHKEQTVENNTSTHIYTEEQLMARLKFFIGICLSLTLFGIVFVVLYSLIFVTQPLNAISPIDQKFFELIIPIATFLTGTLSGIMLASPGDKDAQKQALAAANKGWDKPPTPIAPAPVTPSSSANSFGGFGTPATQPSTFGAPSSGWNSPTANLFSGSAEVGMSSSGKLMPMQPPDPEI